MRASCALSIAIIGLSNYTGASRPTACIRSLATSQVRLLKSTKVPNCEIHVNTVNHRWANASDPATHQGLCAAGVGLAMIAFVSNPAAALEPREQRGFTFARTNCATCHAIGKFGKSSVSEAP